MSCTRLEEYGASSTFNTNQNVVRATIQRVMEWLPKAIRKTSAPANGAVAAAIRATGLSSSKRFPGNTGGSLSLAAYPVNTPSVNSL